MFLKKSISAGKKRREKMPGALLIYSITTLRGRERPRV
jgi:hypothetical protein